MNTSIAFRLKLILALSALITLSVGLLGLQNSSRLAASLERSQSETLLKVRELDEIVAQTLRLRVHVLNHFIKPTEAERKKVEEQARKSDQSLWDHMKTYERLISDPRERAIFDKETEALKQFDTALYAAFEGNNSGDDTAARAGIGAFIKISADAKTVTDEHKHLIDEAIQAERDASMQDMKQLRLYSWIIVIVGVSAVVALGLMLERGIRQGLLGMQSAIARIEDEQDFRIRVPAAGNNELSDMGRRLNRLLQAMQDNLRQIGESANAVAAKSRDMAETAHELATASTQQSESASSMAAAVEEMTVSIGHIGDRAVAANQLSHESGKLAADGNQTIGETVKDINEIASTVRLTSQRLSVVETESDKISSVVAVIREVADQTNLLALNAAIEAARAGEQGRGFAVVADEVRKLAERTANSTREISSIIDGVRGGAKDAVSSMELAVDRVSQGVTRAENASQAIERISVTSQQTVGMVHEITDAIREQSSASTNIAQQVERIAQMAELSSDAAAGSASTARELDQLAASMQKIVQTYKL